MAAGYINGSDMTNRFTEARLKNILNLGDEDALASNMIFLTAISDANAEASTAVLRAYPKTPLRTIPAILIRQTCLLALRNLYDFKEINKSETDADRFREVGDWFVALGRGEIDLPAMSKADEFDALPTETISIEAWTDDQFYARQYRGY
jgi:phage gp36-like protein